jgi:hypothetical protein
MMKIKVIRPTQDVAIFEQNVATVSKELNGFATQTHVEVNAVSGTWYSAVVFYKE